MYSKILSKIDHIGVGDCKNHPCVVYMYNYKVNSISIVTHVLAQLQTASLACSKITKLVIV